MDWLVELHMWGRLRSHQAVTFYPKVSRGSVTCFPDLHHFHHARVARTRHNFSNLAPWVDIVFGTYFRPRGEETYAMGVTERWPEGYLAQLVHPFVALRRRLGSR